MAYLRLYGRALLQVTLVAWNVRNVSHAAYLSAFLTGSALSFVWWANSRSAAHDTGEYARLVYALGAGTGTVLGMVLGGWVG